MGLLKKETTIKLILILSFILTIYGVFMFQAMFHNIDLAYNYAKLQADGYLLRANYADRGYTSAGPTEDKYTINYLYVRSQSEKDKFLFMMLLGIGSFGYAIGSLGKDKPVIEAPFEVDGNKKSIWAKILGM